MKVLITGATSGIGAALARDYARAGHRTITTGRALLGPPNTAYMRADQSEPMEAARRVRDACGERLDVAILNAGMGYFGAVPDPRTLPTIDVNLTATVAIAHAIAPALLEARGSLFIVGSSVRRGHPQMAAYAASKAGLHGFTRALAEEWRGRAHVALLDPGITDTPLLEKAGLTNSPPRFLMASPDRVARAIEHAVRHRHPSQRLTWLYRSQARGIRRRGLK